MDNYDDIINLPHHVSKNHRRMSNTDRAAQFAPFAALTGFEQVIDQAGVYKEKRIIISNEEKIEISNKLSFLKDNIKNNINIEIRYYDDLYGGYVYIKGLVRKIDIYHKSLTVENVIVKFKDIIKLDII